ncbi:hypothetical protein BpHYR1_027285 [Brachionus plicatilis]|uniref:Uncharacterized protein n=1 Tax=Brachionus plicatilis TaxID=10195 RepID=A0A3M7PDN3_BRAPC|nr:hypothetical protein BpHYR1_027285 [Brachionus plicatilis]
MKSLLLSPIFTLILNDVIHKCKTGSFLTFFNLKFYIFLHDFTQNNVLNYKKKIISCFQRVQLSNCHKRLFTIRYTGDNKLYIHTI